MGRLYNTSYSTMGTTSEGGRLYGGRITGKPDISTPEGLYHLAEQSGLGDRAKDIISSKGEKPKTIFSGGFISDVFDTLNALQYGVVGVLKGKSFSEGVKTRQSWSDKDALGEYGIPGTIGGILLDIGCDPLTYIPPIAIAKRVTVVGKMAKGVSKVAKASKIGQWFGRRFIYRFGQSKVYKELAERTIKNIAVGQQNMLDIVQPLTKLEPAIQREIAAARKIGKIAELPKDLLKKAKPAFDELDRLGKEAVRVGLLPDEVWARNLGKYIPRLYKTKELPTEARRILGIFPTKPKRIKIDRFMKRKDIPEDIRKMMGEITEAGYPTAKGLVQLTAATENAKFFNIVYRRWGSEISQAGFKKLPKVKTLGELSGKHIPSPIFDDIQEIIRSKTTLERGLGKVVAGFKFGKVILNPATHGRNIVSNSILNSWEGLNPWRIDIYGEAAAQLSKKGKFYKEAVKEGLGLNTFAANEINNLLLGPEGLAAAGKFKRIWQGTVKKLGDLYQGEENFSKLAMYMFQRKKGLSAMSSWKVAERATFNYAQVTPFIRRLRESIWGFPFITFTYKATGQVARVLVTKPTKISNIGKIKTAIESMSGLGELQRERASEPSWIKDGFYIKLPMKDKYGRSAYFDMTYILPFGDLMSGQLIERGINRKTGLKESYVEALIKKAPFINFIAEIGRNQDFYENQIWKEGDTSGKQLGDLFRHMVKTYMPPLVSDQLPGGYITKGKKTGQRRPAVVPRLKEVSEETQYRTLMEEMLRNVGLKVQPINADIQDSYMNWEKKKALETLLSENGVLQEFERYYIPKGERTPTGSRLYR